MIKYYDKSMVIMYIQAYLKEYFGESVKEVSHYRYTTDSTGLRKRRKVKDYVITKNDPIKVTGYLNAQTYSAIALYMARNYPNEGFPYSYVEVTRGVYDPVSNYKMYYYEDGTPILDSKTGEPLIITPEKLYSLDYINSTTIDSSSTWKLEGEGPGSPIDHSTVDNYIDNLVKCYRVVEDGNVRFYEADENGDRTSTLIVPDQSKIYLDINKSVNYLTTYRYDPAKGYGILGKGAFVYYSKEFDQYIMDKSTDLLKSVQVRSLSDEELLPIIVNNILSVSINPNAISIPDRVLSYLLNEVVTKLSTDEEIVRVKKLIYDNISSSDEPLKYNRELFEIICKIQLDYKNKHTREGQTTPEYSNEYKDFKVTGYVDPWTEILIKDTYGTGEEGDWR